MKAETSIDTDIQPEYPERELTRKILEAAFAAHNNLGSGFLRRVQVKRWQLSCVEVGLFKSKRVR
jgi:hypothetical protein